MACGSICLDLDGTLLNSNKSIGALSKSEIRKKAEQGYTVILASGRHFCEISDYIGQLQLPKGGYVISCDGVYIFDTLGQLIWKNKRMDITDIRYICDITGNKNITYFTSESDVYIITSVKKRMRRKIGVFFKRGNPKRKSFVGRDIVGLKDDLCCNIEKVLIDTTKLVSDKYEQIKANFAVIQYPGGLCEIKKQGTSKFTALVQLQDMNKIDLSDLLYFGDDFNDLECFENLHMCVAMGNAPDQIKQIASDVALTNDEDGVGHFLMKL